MNQAKFKTAFPDFPEADYPELPHDFRDSSWREDSFPSMESDDLKLHIWCDRADPADREFAGARFGVVLLDPTGAAGATLLETDEWPAVLALVDGMATKISIDGHHQTTLGCLCGENEFSRDEAMQALSDIQQLGEHHIPIGGGISTIKRVD